MPAETLTHILKGHADPVTAVAISGDGSRAVSVSDKGGCVWDVPAGALVRRVRGGLGCAVSADGAVVAMCGRGGVWVYAAGAVSRVRGVHVVDCALSADGRTLVYADQRRSRGSEVRVVEWAAGRVWRVWRLEADVVSVAASADVGVVVAAQSMAQGRRGLDVFDAVTGEHLRTVRTTDIASGVSVNHAGTRLAVSENVIRVCSVRDGSVDFDLSAIGHGRCAISSDGAYVVTGLFWDRCGVWNVHSGDLVAMLEGHTCSFSACAISDDARVIVTASTDYMVQVHNVDLESYAESDASSVAELTPPEGAFALDSALEKALAAAGKPPPCRRIEEILYGTVNSLLDVWSAREARGGADADAALRAVLAVRMIVNVAAQVVEGPCTSEESALMYGSGSATSGESSGKQEADAPAITATLLQNVIESCDESRLDALFTFLYHCRSFVAGTSDD